MATFTRRRVIRVGTALAITLPKPWTDYYQVRAGDTVDVTAKSGLVVKLAEGRKKGGEKAM